MDVIEAERLAVMENEVKNINLKLDSSMCNQRMDMERILAKLDNMETKFANKWVEKVSIGSIIVLIGIIATFILQS